MPRFTDRSRLCVAMAGATILWSAQVQSQDTEYDKRTWETWEDMGPYSEYNIPGNIYIRGDPILLTQENKNTGPRLNFVACPIYVDADPTPLWFTRYNDELLFIRAQQNSSGRVRAPQLGHKILVEGVISQEEPIGGAKVLNPVNVSILQELSPECNERWPAHEGIAVAFAKKPPGPGNSGADRQTAMDRLWAFVDILDDPNYPGNPEVEAEQRVFDIEFDFDSETVVAYPLVGAAVLFAKDIGASRVEITAYRGSVLLSNGETLIESPHVAPARAQNIENIIRDYALPPNTSVVTRWVDEPAAATGEDFDNRRATIIVSP